jgi:Cu+-exporting ATPase
VLDKTGTITEGKPKVTDLFDKKSSEIETTETDNEKIKDLLHIMGSCEQHSEHPIGKAIVNYVKGQSIDISEVKEFKTVTGMGIWASFNWSTVLIGSERLMEENKIDVSELKQRAEEIKSEGKTVAFMAIDNEIKAVIGIGDVVRETSEDAIQRISDMGVEIVMLTGDNEIVAEAIGKEMHIKSVHANLKPSDKCDEIKKLQQNGKVVGMIGDGINDAPALATADVSFAIGTATEIAMEAANITLVKGDITKAWEALRLSRQTMKIIKQNLFWAFGYNVIAIPFAALGLLNPMIAAGAMAFSSVSVVTNSLRLRKFKIK